MEDVEDDARYPPNPYPRKKHHHRRPFPSSSPPRSKPPRYDSDASDDLDSPADASSDDADDVSSSSRGKRRRVDRFASGFEFAPRASPSSSAPRHSRNSVPDWSEASTFALLDAWGDLFVHNGRKSLRSDEWAEVARKVSHSSKTPRSDAQCRNRVDTLKKKYKKEKTKIFDHEKSSSNWVYFKKMEKLMSSPSPPPQQQPPRLPCGVDAGEYVFGSSRVYLNKSNGMDEMRDSPGDTESEDGEEENEGEEEDDDSEGLPPVKDKGVGSASYRMLADSIQKFGEIYEKIEDSKRQQMAELERMRKEFQRDLEMQKRQILERAQAEIARMGEVEGEEEEDGDVRVEEEEEDDDGVDGSAENLSG